MFYNISYLSANTMKPSKLVKGKQYWVPNGDTYQQMTYTGIGHGEWGYSYRFYLFQPKGTNHPGNRIGLASWRVEEDVWEDLEMKQKYTQLALELV